MKVGAEDTQLIITMDWIRHNGLADITWHTANERSTSPQAGSILKRKGVLSGVADIFIARASGAWNGCFIELKVKGGKLSPAQSKFLESMARENYFTAVRYSADEAIATIREYLQMT